MYLIKIQSPIQKHQL